MRRRWQIDPGHAGLAQYAPDLVVCDVDDPTAAHQLGLLIAEAEVESGRERHVAWETGSTTHGFRHLLVVVRICDEENRTSFIKHVTEIARETDGQIFRHSFIETRPFGSLPTKFGAVAGAGLVEFRGTTTRPITLTEARLRMRRDRGTRRTVGRVTYRPSSRSSIPEVHRTFPTENAEILATQLSPRSQVKLQTPHPVGARSLPEHQIARNAARLGFSIEQLATLLQDAPAGDRFRTNGKGELSYIGALKARAIAADNGVAEENTRTEGGLHSAMWDAATEACNQQLTPPQVLLLAAYRATSIAADKTDFHVSDRELEQRSGLSRRSFRTWEEALPIDRVTTGRAQSRRRVATRVQLRSPSESRTSSPYVLRGCGAAAPLSYSHSTWAALSHAAASDLHVSGHLSATAILVCVLISTDEPSESIGVSKSAIRRALATLAALSLIERPSQRSPWQRTALSLEDAAQAAGVTGARKAMAAEHAHERITEQRRLEFLHAGEFKKIGQLAYSERERRANQAGRRMSPPLTTTRQKGHDSAWALESERHNRVVSLSTTELHVIDPVLVERWKDLWECDAALVIREKGLWTARVGPEAIYATWSPEEDLAEADSVERASLTIAANLLHSYWAPPFLALLTGLREGLRLAPTIPTFLTDLSSRINEQVSTNASAEEVMVAVRQATVSAGLHLTLEAATPMIRAVNKELGGEQLQISGETNPEHIWAFNEAYHDAVVQGADWAEFVGADGVEGAVMAQTILTRTLKSAGATPTRDPAVNAMRANTVRLAEERPHLLLIPA